MTAASLTELERLKGSFLAIISHELRTPLTEILAASAVLGDGYLGNLTDEQRHYLEVIVHSSEQLNKLIQDLLAFAQLQADIVETQKETGDLNQVARAAVDLYRAAIRDKKLLLVLRLAPDLAPIPLDRLKMLRVFSNLLSNGINFTPEGGRIMVRTRAVDEFQVFDVADTGIGIPKDKQAHIFDSFYQVEDALTRRVGGLGLGLAYARRIVEAHGGRISCESLEGEGSIFSVWLPTAFAGAGPGPVTETAA